MGNDLYVAMGISFSFCMFVDIEPYKYHHVSNTYKSVGNALQYFEVHWT